MYAIKNIVYDNCWWTAQYEVWMVSIYLCLYNFIFVFQYGVGEEWNLFLGSQIIYKFKGNGSS